ncbi:hypothetical protein ACFV27_37385 [Streptomyces antimycoticus]|uniref:hypothetical protein n=1 Tax=Streptomyces antimycoticus TaxID=68175 RepID=UPI0036830745
MAPAYRYLTQDALTGAWLHTALPLTNVEYGPELKGPGALTGTLSPKFVSSNPAYTDPGTTLIYIERDSRLDWGGLIWRCEPEGSEYRLEAASWSSYLAKRLDLDGELGGRGPYTYTDPCKIIRDVWDYAQSIPDGDLSVAVDTITSTATVGTPEEPWHSYWWEPTPLGDRIDDLVSEADAPEYTCDTAWATSQLVPSGLYTKPSGGI